MAITFRSVSTVASSASSPLTVSAPAGLAEFDKMLLQVSTNGSGTITPPSGFTLVDSIVSGFFNIRVYEKTATASEPASYDVAHTGGDDMALGIVAWTPGSGKTCVVDAFANQTNASSTNRVCPGVTTTRANDALSCFFALDGGANSTPDAAMTERWDYGLTIRMYLMTQIVSAAGATGTRTATGSAQASKCVTVALYETDPVVGAPSSLSATAVSTLQINLAWIDASSNESGFEVERSADGSTGWSNITTTAANATSYNNTSLSEHALWYYRVRAVNADGATAYSSVVNATTFLIPPTSLTATSAGSTQINLAWTDNSSAEASYRVEQSPNGSTGWVEIATTAANTTSYNVTSLADNTTFYFRVRAAAGSDRSTYSNTANAITDDALATPSTLVATPLGIRRIVLTWVGTNADEVGTEIYQSLNSMTGFALIATVAAGVETYTASGLTPATTYYFKVRDKK